MSDSSKRSNKTVQSQSSSSRQNANNNNLSPPLQSSSSSVRQNTNNNSLSPPVQSSSSSVRQNTNNNANLTPLAIRGRMTKDIRKQYSKKLVSNPEYPTQPNLYMPSGPQPFVSKGRLHNPNAPLPKKLSDQALKNHATSSDGSFGVSFTAIGGPKSRGYEAQFGFNKNKSNQTYLTTQRLNAMQENRHKSGNEEEWIAQGHRHVDDTTMMQHEIKRTSHPKTKKTQYQLRSQRWVPTAGETPAHWESIGGTHHFGSYKGAFDKMLKRGRNIHTHLAAQANNNNNEDDGKGKEKE